MDTLTPEKRSWNMSRIHCKGTKPEELVRKYLFAQGFRYRKNDKRLPGKPDIVLPKYKTVIFVNGCFWHHHEGCKYGTIPKTNTEFWENKINKTIERDVNEFKLLKALGWKVIIIWECETERKVFINTMERMISQIYYF